MDRERLQQVQQSDVGESRINEDFLNWIKTSGPWYLLAILVGIAVYLYLINMQRAELRVREQAWFDLADAGQPASLEDVAQRHGEIDGVATLARLRAANIYLQSIHTNLAIGATLEDGTPLAEEDRVTGLDQANRLYMQVLDSDRGEFGDTVATVSALNGLAAIAESRGDVAQAKSYYEQAAQRAGDWYPPLANQARSKAASADLYDQPIILPDPPAPVLPPTVTTPNLEPLDVDNILNLPTPPTAPVQDDGPVAPAGDAESSETPAAEPTPPTTPPPGNS